MLFVLCETLFSSLWGFLFVCLVSSPEHEVLTVSYCGQSMSVVRRASCVVRRPSCVVRLFFSSSPKPKSQLTPNMVGSIGVTYRSNIVKIVLIGNPDGRQGGHLENLFFAPSPEPKCQLIPNWLRSIGVTYRSK